MPTLEQSAAALKELTKNVPRNVVGMDKLSTEERTRMLVMACANVIVHTLFLATGRNHARATEGLDALIVGMRANLKKLSES